ncbi:MAG: pitrilysin family protein [Pseudomonadales bacterium]|jgi:predicted Zn-dependent peptidase|nr:pitrilysin family protein [Pseudomonadales bacterium]
MVPLLETLSGHCAIASAARKAAFRALCLLAVCTPTAVGVRAEDTDASALADYFEERVLSFETERWENGFTLLVNRRPQVPNASLRLLVEVGTADFPCPERELPHLLEHVLFSGFDELSEADLDLLASHYGGSLNGFTAEWTTGYELDLYAAHASDAVQLLFGMVTRTPLNAERVDASRPVVHREVGDPRNAFEDWLARAGWFDGHVARSYRELVPATRSFCPRRPHAALLSAEDVQRVHERYYVPERMTLIVVGDVDPGRIVEEVNDTFGAMEAQPGAPRHRPEPLLRGNEVSYRTARDEFVAADVYVTRDYLIPPLPAPGTFPLLLAAELLEGDLFTRLRSERGWAYTPSVTLADYADFSVLVLEAEVPRGREDETLEVMDDAVAALAEGEIGSDRFESVRRQAVLQYGLGLETNADVADYYTRFFEHWRTSGTFPNLVRAVASITEAAVQVAVRRHLVDAPSLRYTATGLVGSTSALLAGFGSTILFGLLLFVLRKFTPRRSGGPQTDGQS